MENCTCIPNVNVNTLNKLKELHPDRTYEPASLYGSENGLQNVAFSFGDNSGPRVYFNYKSRFTFTKTNGQTSAPKTENINIYATFCPFCGAKIEN